MKLITYLQGDTEHIGVLTPEEQHVVPVSYTHLTLPTILRV